MLKKKIFPNLIIVAIIALGVFLRLYHLPQWFHFASDEARDLFIVKDIFEKGDIPFRGPTLSITGTGDKAGFLGPIYYYLIALPFLIGNGHPLSPVIFTAILSIATIYLLYRIGKDFINVSTGLITALLYAVSFLTVTFSRAAWNPNILPFFVALGIYSFLKILNGREKYIIWLALSSAIAVQLHSTAFLWPIVILISWIVCRYRHPERAKRVEGSRDSQNDKGRIWLYLWSAGIFITILAPWIAAEMRSGFANTNAYLSVLGSKTETFAGETYVPPSLWLTFFNFFDEILTNRMMPGLTGLIITGTIIFFIVQTKSYIMSFLPRNPVQGKLQQESKIKTWIPCQARNDKKQNGTKNNIPLPITHYPLLITWLFISFVGYYFYKHILFIHYFIFLFPLVILLVSIFLGWIWQKKWMGKIFVIVTIVIIIGANLYSFADYARAMNNRRLDKFTHATDTPFIDIDQVVRYIKKDADQPFRLHFILPSGPLFQNSRAYEYMLEYYGARKPVSDNAEIVYVIIQPKDIAWHEEISGLGKVEEIKEFGVIRMVKINAKSKMQKLK